DYIRWVKQIQNMGYDYDYKILNCADYGAYTSRVRYFGCFARKGLSYSFPLPTHAKKPISGMFGQLKKWKPVREVLDLHDTGKSIFDRKKDLSDRTLERILSGLKKFGGQHFLQQYYSGDPKNKVKPLNAPCPTLTTIPHEGLVAVIQYNGNSDSHRVNKPIGTLTTKDRFGVVQYLFNPQYQSKGGSIDNPCFTLIARMDKAPPGLLTAVPAPLIADKETDTPTMKQLKNYMRQHQIGDVHMRMLNIPELKRITGLPVDYTLLGTKANQKKFIGNAVPPPMVAALIGECVG
ncbi:MAG: DNA cytosine methyltransferase, partial [Saprospiraceae bacterium]